MRPPRWLFAGVVSVACTQPNPHARVDGDTTDTTSMSGPDTTSGSDSVPDSSGSTSVSATVTDADVTTTIGTDATTASGTDVTTASDADATETAPATTSSTESSSTGDVLPCDNRIHDGMETDIDCGGEACSPCDHGSMCEDDRDCVSKVCTTSMRCAVPTCSDTVHNGEEAGIDCGGQCEVCVISPFHSDWAGDGDESINTKPYVAMWHNGTFVLAWTATPMDAPTDAMAAWFDEHGELTSDPAVVLYSGAEQEATGVAILSSESEPTVATGAVVPIRSGVDSEGVLSFVSIDMLGGHVDDHVLQQGNLYGQGSSPTVATRPGQALFAFSAPPYGLWAYLWNAENWTSVHGSKVEVGLGEPYNRTGDDITIVTTGTIFTIVWHWSDLNGLSNRIRYRRMSFSGEWLDSGNIREVDQDPLFEYNKLDPSVAALTDGRLVAAWRREKIAMFRFIDTNGIPQGSESVATHAYDHKLGPVVAGLRNGGFALAWIDEGDDTVVFERRNADGTLLGPEREHPWPNSINATKPAIAANADHMVVLWEADVNAKRDIVGQLLSY